MTSDRVPDHDINPMFSERYSTRTFASADAEPITDDELKQLFEAARWAPSYANGQPWRFVFVRKSNTEAWNRVFDTLWPLNQKWVENAQVLLVVLSNKKTTYGGNVFDSPTHSFDTGAATAQLLLQARELRIATHPIGGFDYEKVKQVFVDDRADKDDYAVNAIVVMGRAVEQIPEHELPRSDRKAISEFAFENGLPAAE